MKILKNYVAAIPFLWHFYVIASLVSLFDYWTSMGSHRWWRVSAVIACSAGISFIYHWSFLADRLLILAVTTSLVACALRFFDSMTRLPHPLWVLSTVAGLASGIDFVCGWSSAEVLFVVALGSGIIGCFYDRALGVLIDRA